MDIRIRKFSAADVENVVALCLEVQEIHASLFPDVFKRLDSTALSEWFHERLVEDGVTVLLAIVDDSVVGFLLLRSIERPEHLFCFKRRYIEIEQICVAESARYKGVGRKLVDAAKDVALNSGFGRLELNVWTDNSTAKHAFECLGFSTYTEKMVFRLDSS